MTDVSQQAVAEGIDGALARLNASHQAVKDAAAQVYADKPAPVAGTQSAAPLPSAPGAGS